MYFDTQDSLNETPSINQLLILQMQHEMINYRTYLNFSGICDSKGLLGASKFFRKQSEDELKHFNLIYDFCCDRIEFIPNLLELPAMNFESDMLLESMLRSSLDLEQNTTFKLCYIKKQAIIQDDFITDSFLDSLINEQREEEKLAQIYYSRCLLFGGTTDGIMMLDKELGA